MPSRMTLPARPARPRGDAGAGSVEYIGAILVVVAIVLSLTVSATPVGDTIMARICAAFGAQCGADVAAPEESQPDQPCTVTSTTDGIDAGVSIAFIDIDGGGKVVVDKLSNETYRVTLDGKATAAAVASAGEAVFKGSVMDYGTGLELSADARAGVFTRSGVEFTFPDETSKNQFTDWIRRTLVRTVAQTAGGPAVGIGTWFYDKVTGYDYSPPAPSALYGEAGVTAGAGASAGLITAGGNASASVSNSVGAKHDIATGETTVYTKLDLSAKAAARIGFSTKDDDWGQGAGGSTQVELVVGTTYKDGEIVKVALDGAATAEGSAALTHLAGFPLQGEGGRGVRMSVEMPVTDANRDRILPTLVGIGALASGVGALPLPEGTALPQLMTEARRSGADITAQTLDVSSSELFDAAVSLKAPAVGGLGFRATAGGSEQQTMSAYYASTMGWKPWTRCVD